jgi:hypothetical protein
MSLLSQAKKACSGRLRTLRRLEIPKRAARLSLGHAFLPSGKTRLDHTQNIGLFLRQIITVNKTCRLNSGRGLFGYFN